MQLHCTSCELTVTDDCTCSCAILSVSTTTILSIVVICKKHSCDPKPTTLHIISVNACKLINLPLVGNRSPGTAWP